MIVQNDVPIIDRHRTAPVRTDLSRPVRLALEHGPLPEGASAFDVIRRSKHTGREGMANPRTSTCYNLSEDHGD